MTAENDFLPFATGSSANVLSQSDYAALDAVTNGFKAGVAPSNALNKAWRQSSIMAAVMAQFIVAETGQAAIDDGTTATLLANFTKAVVAASKQRVILTDTGAANAYTAANAVPMTALPTVSGIVQTVQISHANTTASTYAPDGLAAKPIYGLGGVALQGSELPVNGIATLVSYVGPLLNGGALCWVLYECIGGAQQVAAATASMHAVNLGQFAASLGASGYQKLPSGLILQWGFGTSSGATANNFSATFPIAFPNACLCANLTVSGSTAGNYTVQYTSSTATTLKGTTELNGSYSTAVNVVWFAIGY